MEEILMEDWNGQNKQLSNFECAAQTGGIAGYFFAKKKKKKCSNLYLGTGRNRNRSIIMITVQIGVVDF